MTLVNACWARLISGLPLLLVAAFLVGLLAACGGSGDDDGGAADFVPTAATDSGNGPGAGDEPSDDDGAPPPFGSSPPDCQVLRGLFGPNPVGENPLSSLSIRESQALLAQLGSQGPDVIRADLQLLAEGLVPFFDALEEMGVRTVGELQNLDSDAQAQLASVMDSISTEEFRLAERNVGSYISREC